MQSVQGNQSRVLVVDDEAHIVMVVALKLRNAGFDVETASDGDEALAILQGSATTNRAIDLVVTDLQMPVMNGIELACAMNHDARLAKIPVLMLTARGHLLRDGEATDANIARIIHKPFSPKGLLLEVERLLGLGGLAA